MKMNKNVARLAVTAGLSLAMGFGGIMAPVAAFAGGNENGDGGDDPNENSIVINQAWNNGATSFKAYQIFKADVAYQNGGKVVSNVEWASDAAKTAVLGVLTGINGSGITNDSSAQDVADYLSKNVTDTTTSTRVDKDHVLNKIAKAVKGSVTPTGDSFKAGEWFTAQSNGYYLFLTDDSTIGQTTANKKNTGTSPIFAVVGGDGVKITEKTSIPTVDKKIKDDKPGSVWADKGDSQMGQNVQYQLTGTVADNVATFDTYYYEFHDELSAGLMADASSVAVKIDGTKVDASKYTVAYDTTNNNNTLTVKFNDLKSAGVDITKDSKVVVTYTAKLDATKAQKVTVGGQGNPNTVKLIYSNNPMSTGKGESTPDTVRDYTYALKLVKEDSANEQTKLEGVKFTIQATGADEGAGTKYVQEDGSLGDHAYEFETNKKGEINVKGLDAGTYTVQETHTLDGYNTLPDFTFTIKAEGLDQKEGNNNLTVTTSKSGSDLVVDPSFDNGTVSLTVKNKKGSGLPLTGLNGVTLTWVAGGAVLVIGVAHLIRSRKAAEASEE